MNVRPGGAGIVVVVVGGADMLADVWSCSLENAFHTKKQPQITRKTTLFREDKNSFDLYL